MLADCTRSLAQIGSKLAEMRAQRFTCFVAACKQPPGVKAPAGGTSEPSFLERASDNMLHALLDFIEMPEAYDTWGMRFDDRGIVGAVVFDCLGEHLPQRKSLVDGVWTWEKRSEVAYVSNLCVAPSMQR